MKYLRDFETIESSKAATLYSPTVIRVSNEERDRPIWGAVEIDDTLLKVHEDEELLEDLYIIPAKQPAPKRKIHFIIDDDTEFIIEDNKLPEEMPIPTAPTRKVFRGWYYDTGFTEEAHGGDQVTEETLLFAKFVSDTLTFYIKSAIDSTRLTINEVDTITINEVTYTQAELLAEHYGTEINMFHFANPGNYVRYEIITTETSEFKNTGKLTQSFDTLTGQGIPLLPKSASTGDIMITASWEDNTSVENIFDLYSVGYLGAAPDFNNINATGKKIVELSYEHLDEKIITDITTGKVDFKIKYTTLASDWSIGEYTTITLGENMSSIENLLRKYSFVFILNDYNPTQPGYDGSDGSSFERDSQNMVVHFQMPGTQIEGVSITLNLLPKAEGVTTEIGNYSSNWLICKTRLLGKDESITSMADILEIFTYSGSYSYLDKGNNCTTTLYNLTSGGQGVIN